MSAESHQFLLTLQSTQILKYLLLKDNIKPYLIKTSGYRRKSWGLPFWNKYF